MPITTRSTGRGNKSPPEQDNAPAQETADKVTSQQSRSTPLGESESATTAATTTITTDSSATEITASTAPDTSATSVPPSTIEHRKKNARRDAVVDRSTRKEQDPPAIDEHQGQLTPRAPSKHAGSTRSRTKMQRIAKAKEEVLRLKLELANARLSLLENEDTDEDDEGSVYSNTENNTRVNTWLKSQEPGLLAITDNAYQSHQEPIALPPAVTEANTQEKQEQENLQPPMTSHPYVQSTPAGEHRQPDFSELTSAITQAIKAGQRSLKCIDLPIFDGNHQEWLAFYAAYRETEESLSATENINRLRRSLKGKAREAVERLLITNIEASTIMKTLETRFGRPESIAMAEIEILRSLPRLSDSPRDICVFATKVMNAVSTLQALKCVYYLYNPEVAKTIVDKFTPVLRYRYFDFAARQPREQPDLLKIEKFLEHEAELCGPYAQPEPPAWNNQQRRPQKINTVTEKPLQKKCLTCEETTHNIANCKKFRDADTNDRWDIAKKHNLCFRCLQHRNKTHHCRPRRCGIDECKYSHHRMLHHKRKESTSAKETEDEPTETINSAWTTTNRNKQSYLKIIPVEVSGPKGKMNTYALLDDGSTVTLIDSSIADIIGAKGPVDPLHIEAINKLKTEESKSRRIDVVLKGRNGHQEKIQARTVNNLKVSPQVITKEQIEACEHLRHLGHMFKHESARPKILIGQDNWHLLLTTIVRKGSKNQLVASLTPLGWVLHGVQSRSLGRSVNFVSHLVDTPKEDHIEDLVKQYFEMDALCIKPRKPKSDPEEKALRILEENTQLTENGSYQTSLLWKTKEVTLPDNYDNSLRRLYAIEKKIDRDPELKQKYNEQMEALIKKGYAEPAPENKSMNRTWYLPHFAVINPMKPDKLRVVHDAAAKTKGVALNDLLLKGPDLLQSLPGVIMRFRQHEVAITADIKEMFMQVKLKTEDRDALRYLWRRDRRGNQPPEEYRMTSLIFGASCSPSTAIFVKDLNAKKHEHSHPEAALAIKRKHYVDDYLDSFRTLEDAVRIARDVRTIQRKACFDLKQWKSNSPQLLEALGEHEQAEETELYKAEEKFERVLGIVWKSHADELTFNLNLARIPQALIEGKTPTKREALKVVMSLFDPLGFASPVTIRAKQILQEVWRRGTSWDEEVEEDIAEQWKTWMCQLRNLKNIVIPRKYLHYSDATSLQLHIFTDASEAAYTAVLYWRATTPDGNTRLSLVLAKSKVAPLKLTSIPRLELQAAVMGTRLAETVIEEHERKPDSKTFWTDSKTVLTWIRTGSRSYKPYVAHRIAAIEEATTVNEWRWVPTKLNVADDATRDVPVGFNSKHRWYTGPEFLYDDSSMWPTETIAAPIEASGEERTHHIATKEEFKISEGLPEATRFSSWDRLHRTTARVIQFLNIIRTVGNRTHNVHYSRNKKNEKPDPDWRRTQKKETKRHPEKKRLNSIEKKYVPLTAECLRQAENLLMKASQEDSFATEIQELKRGKQISKDSRLHQLSVIIEEHAIKIRSRIRATQDISENLKEPMVVDGQHHIVKLWILNVHKLLHHAGVEATVNECRQQYWILKLRPTVRSLLRRCLMCRLKTQTPPYPRTGNLPSCRLAHHKRPFTYTGVDYFGPLTIKIGRAVHKRYVAIFTCLTTRAIHLEIAASLTTDSAIMALRRMIARRGCPTEIWSDNGTNLRGADKELRQAMDEATAEEATKKMISWRFIPPGAPFMGGAWERMVRSVKTALQTVLTERHPSEEVLATLLAEVEYTVNSRPLTHVSVDVNDPEALTPNHFLLGGPARVPTPGRFSEQDTVGKSSWRTAQRLADMFWTRWVKEYLPDLQNRREPHGRGPAMKKGDLVQVIDGNLPRNTWIRGKIIATYPGPDDIVRTVDIATKGGVLRRPVRKLILLPIEDVVPAHEELRRGRTAGEMCRTTSFEK